MMPHSRHTESIPLRIAITMGDPAGVGPQIILKAFAGAARLPAADYIVVGDAAILDFCARDLGLTNPCTAADAGEDIAVPGPRCLDCKTVTPADIAPARPQAAGGRAAFRYIDTAIRLALDGKVDAVVTAPINKEALHMAGYEYPGHTEIFAEKSGAGRYAMMFYLDRVGVAHVTTHCSVREAVERITAHRVYDTIRTLHEAIKMIGHSAPRIAVGGLNPHAGEGGMFGSEERDHIAPAIERACKEGIAVSGPFPPDTVFMRAFKGEFDGVVAMLHDHGFVALKSKNFERGVNVTIGLPIIRTSVGHGTAYDIVTKGTADPASLIAAIEVAHAMAAKKRDLTSLPPGEGEKTGKN